MSAGQTLRIRPIVVKQASISSVTNAFTLRCIVRAPVTVSNGCTLTCITHQTAQVGPTTTDNNRYGIAPIDCAVIEGITDQPADKVITARNGPYSVAVLNKAISYQVTHEASNVGRTCKSPRGVAGGDAAVTGATHQPADINTVSRDRSTGGGVTDLAVDTVTH